uniref:Putative DNA binding, helix-turn-helix domain containing protein n=1 Tax=viral metagenome TaxID=1070528 RepID=A0A6H1ZD33_9ZZZZ
MTNLPKIDDPMLPNKPLFRPNEVADYFGYEISTIYTWIQHGILKAEKYKGTYRISREAILTCRLRSQIDPLA